MSVLARFEKKIKTRSRARGAHPAGIYLNEQMKAIHRELGDADDGKRGRSSWRKIFAATKLSKRAREKGRGRGQESSGSMSPMSAEAHPWCATTWMDAVDPLGREVAGFEKGPGAGPRRSWICRSITALKRSRNGSFLVEYLAVAAAFEKLKARSCALSPAGRGQDQPGQIPSPRPRGANFIRISLGGLRDESEIRGHRRTYIGSMPGKIIQALKKAKTTNPLILLDENRQDGPGFSGGGPGQRHAGKVLDPEQNSTFK